jgi:hypothetical protein
MGIFDESVSMEEEPEEQTIWAIWVADPLTKDADILLRWSKTSFYVGCPKPTLMFFNGKEYSLFMRSSNFNFIIERADVDSLYYREVRLTRNGTEVNIEPRTKDIPKPPDDLLGCGSSLCGGSC